MDRPVPEFTREQEDWICHQIGEWYLEWKNQITEHHTHRLGVAKEMLKIRLCKPDFEVLSELQIEGN